MGLSNKAFPPSKGSGDAKLSPLSPSPCWDLRQLSADGGGSGPAAPAVLGHVGWKDERKPKEKKSKDGDEYDSTESSLDKCSRLPHYDAASLEGKKTPTSPQPSWSSPLSRGVADVT